MGKVQGTKSERAGSLLRVNDQAQISQATQQFARYATVFNWIILKLRDIYEVVHGAGTAHNNLAVGNIKTDKSILYFEDY